MALIAAVYAGIVNIIPAATDSVTRYPGSASKMESLAAAAIVGITITPGHIECTTSCTEAMRLGLSGDSPALTTMPSGFTVIPGSATAAIAALAG